MKKKKKKKKEDKEEVCDEESEGIPACFALIDTILCFICLFHFSKNSN